jgi:oligosaccharide repeat unit polymerase
MSPDSILFLFISIMIMLIPVFHSLAKGELELFSPPAIFAFGFTASYGIKGWLVALDRDVFLTYPDLFTFDQDAATIAHILSWLGLTMFFLGYYRKQQNVVFLQLRLSRLGFRITYAMAVLFSVLSLLSVGWLVVLVWPYILSGIMAFGDMHVLTLLRDSLMFSWEDYPMLYHFPVYAGFFGVLAFHAKKVTNEQMNSNKHGSLSILFVLTIILLVLVVLGSRQLLLAFIFSLVLYRHYFMKRISGHKQLIVLVLLVLIGAYLGIIQKSLDPSITQAHDMPFPKNIAFRLSSSYEQFEDLAGIIAKDPPLDWGRSFAEDILFTYIPRVLWPSKPTDFGFIRAQNTLFSDYWVVSRAATYPIGVLGELYYNFWYVGIPLGMFFLGYILKAMCVRSQIAHSLWPPILVTTVASFLGPHRCFGTNLMLFCLYILLAKMIQFSVVLVPRKKVFWSSKRGLTANESSVDSSL